MRQNIHPSKMENTVQFRQTQEENRQLVSRLANVFGQRHVGIMLISTHNYKCMQCIRDYCMYSQRT